MNDTTQEDICYEWMHNLVNVNSTSIEELNNVFKRRNIGGIIFVSFLSFIGLVGNLHVLWIFIRQFKQSEYRTYVLCLALLDLVNCTVGMPLTVVYLNYPVMFPSEAFCKVYRFFLYYVSIASTMILVIIAVDRYMKVCRPMARHLREKDTVVVCVFGLVLGLVFAWPAPFLYGNSEIHFPVMNITGHRCFTADDMKHLPYQKIFNTVLTSLFAIILTLLIVLYFFIIKVVRKHDKFQKRTKSCSKNQMSIRENEKRKNHGRLRRTTITLLLVTAGYVTSALPHHALAISIFVIPKFDCNMSLEWGIVYYTFIWIFLLNNVINPVIYTFTDKRFWLKVKIMYGKGTPESKTSRLHNNSTTITKNQI